MKRFASACIFAVLLFVICIQTAASGEIENYSNTIAYTNCKANLREETSTKSDRITALSKGTEVVIVETVESNDDIWCYITVNKLNVEGYILLSLLDIDDEKTSGSTEGGNPFLASPDIEEPIQVPNNSNENVEEILFRDMPWMEDAISVNNLLGDFGLYKRDPEEAWFIYTWNDLKLHSDYTMGYDIGIIGDEKTVVGGHIIDSSWLYFLYDFNGTSINTNPENTHFYIANYMFQTKDVESAYNDLYIKMTNLYGTATVNITTHNGSYFYTTPSVSYKGETRTAIWYGANNTAVKIIAEINTPEDRVAEVKEATESIEMWYGKTDMDDTIRQMEAFLEQQAIGSEKNSTDGL